MNTVAHFLRIRPRGCSRRTPSSLGGGLAAAIVTLCLVAASPGQEFQTQVAPLPQGSSSRAAQAYSVAAELQNENDFVRAQRAWSQFLQSFSDDPLARHAQHHLGVCEIQLNHFPQATRAFQQVLSGDDRFELREEASVNLGWCHYVLGSQGDTARLKEAAATFRNYQRQFPDGEFMDQALFYEAESLQQLGSLPTAEDRYRSLIDGYADSPLNAAALFALGNVLHDQHKYEDAITIFDRFLEDHETDGSVPDVTMRKAQSFMQLREYAEAEKNFALAAEFEGYYAVDQATFQRGYCLAVLDKFEQAADVFQQLTKDHPDSELVAQAQLEAGRCLYRAQEFDAAIVALKQLLEQDDLLALEAAHWISRILLTQEKPRVALKAAETALQLTETVTIDAAFKAALLLDHAEALHRLGDDIPAAIRAYLEIVNEHGSSPSAPWALYYAVQATSQIGDHRQSVTLAQKFLHTFADHKLAERVKSQLADSLSASPDQAASERTLRQLLLTSEADASLATIQLRLGQTLFVQEKYEECLHVLAPLVMQWEPGTQRARANYLLGVSYLECGSAGLAAERLSASLLEAPRAEDAPHVCHNLARALESLDRTADARLALQQLLETYPDHELAAPALYRLAQLGGIDGSPDLSQLQTLVTSHPKTRWAQLAHLQLAQNALGQSHHTAVESHVASVLQSSPEPPLRREALRVRVTSRQSRAMWNACLDDLARLVAGSPDDTERTDWLYGMATCLREMGRHREQVQAWEKVLAADSEERYAAEALYHLARLADEAGQDAASVRQLANLVERFPQHSLAARAHWELGEATYAAAEYDRAVPFYDAVVTSPHADAALQEKALYKLGWCYTHLDERGLAADAFTQVARRNPKGPLAVESEFMLAESLFASGQHDVALDLYERVAESPELGAAARTRLYLHAGQSCLKQQSWDDARFWLRRIVRESPDVPEAPEAHLGLAQAYEQQGTTGMAKEHYRMAAQQKSPIGARARLALGTMLLAQEEWDRALREFQTLMYSYGGRDASADVKELQAEAGHAAARTAIHLAQHKQGAEGEAFRATAAKCLNYVAEWHPQSPQAIACEETRIEIAAQPGVQRR